MNWVKKKWLAFCKWDDRRHYLCQPSSEKERLQAEIRDILIEECPAFYFIDTGGGSIWHKCYCKDRPLLINSPFREDHYDPCDCVWHAYHTCHRGEQPKVKNLFEKPIEKHKENK